MATLLTPKEKIFARYNKDLQDMSQPPVDPADFVVSTPAAYSGPRANKNSVIYLQPKPESSNIGLATVYYDRLNLATVTGLKVAKGTATNITELLPSLNIELGLQFEATDFNPATLPTTVPGSFTLTATPSNMLWTGSTTVMLD